jgi:hypothetical protein
VQGDETMAETTITITVQLPDGDPDRALRAAHFALDRAFGDGVFSDDDLLWWLDDLRARMIVAGQIQPDTDADKIPDNCAIPEVA